MKATMVFTLPEEKTDFTLAINGNKMYCTLWELDQWLRGQIKYADREELDEVRDKLRELMNDNNIDFDMFE